MRFRLNRTRRPTSVGSVRATALLACALLLALSSRTSVYAQSGEPGTAGNADTLPANNDVNDATDNTDVGLVQIELGGVFTRTGPVTRSTASPFTARYGAFEWLEVSLGADGFMGLTDQGLRSSGFGNLQAGGKLRLFGAAGGLPILSLLPQVTIPTANADAGLGTGDVDVAVGLLSGRDLPHGSHVDVGYGVGAIGEGAGLGRFVQHTASLSASLGVTPAWTPSLTVSWISRQDAVTGRALLLTGESVVTLSHRVALDASAQFGLSAEAPALEVAGGISFVLGELGLDEGVHARRHHLRLRSRRRTTTRRS